MLEQKYHWKVANSNFFNKNDALWESTRSKNPISFHVGNVDYWKKDTVFKFEGINLDNLYLIRALSLRYRYKKLKLFFSGGSDSLNILQTFIKNNITIDEIIVRWSAAAIDGNFYTPNNVDKSANNSLSEWNYSINPVLKHVASAYPKIKITIENNTRNCLENIETFSVDNFLKLFEKFTPIRGSVGSIIQRMGLEDECKKGESIHETANIFGIEKPLLYYKNNNYYFSFCDLPFEVSIGHNSGVVEPFYWTPDMPEIVLAQAKILAKFYNKNPCLKQWLMTEHYHPGNQKKIHMQNIIGKSVLYSNWNNNTFQAEKPNFYRNDWWGWLENHLAVDKTTLNTNFNQASLIYYGSMDSKYIRNNGNTHNENFPHLPHAVFSEFFPIKL